MLIATLVVVAVNAFHIWQKRNIPPQPLRVESSHHLYDAGHHLLLGVVIAALIALWRRARPARTRLDYGALWLCSLAVGAFVLPADYANFARRTAASELFATLTLVALVTLSSSMIALFTLVSRWLATRWRLLPLAAGVGLLVLNHRILLHDYPGVHFLLALLAGACCAAALATAPVPAWWPRVPVRVTYIVFGILGTFTLLVWPTPIVLHELLKLDGSVATRFLTHFRSKPRIGKASVPPAQRPWFTRRTHAAAVPATTPALLRGDGVVVLITVDALRADVLNGRRHDARLPTLAKLRDESVSFTLARSPSSQTMMSLGTLFSGTYFSQQYWTEHPKQPLVWPHEEPSVRFPEMLARAGVPTVTFSGAPWLTNAFGVVRGFSEERFIRTDVKYTRAIDLVNATLPRLERHGKGPLFLFIHLLDAHAPYDSASGESAFERYLGELALVDQQIARLVSLLNARFADRAALIVTADHGEAFAEHGAYYHATALYEEQIRVPLVISLPGVTPRAVSTPVSLVDLGPTILDVFGLATPGHFMGQSLTPFLRGESPTLTRPIAAEVRLMHMLIDHDGYKSIIDDRTHIGEVYDLGQDPGEHRNLNDGSAPPAARLALLDAFFSAHRNQRPGYKLPFRP